MIRGLNSAATALDAAMKRQEVMAENLAHVATPGYRSRGITFESFATELAHSGVAPSDADINGVKLGKSYHDFRPGPIRPTGSPYDLALEGDSFFSLQGPDGTLYTRNGSFHVGPEGDLLSAGNYPVMGANGPISIPTEARTVMVNREGDVSADGIPLGKIRLARFETPANLRQVGPTLFEAPPSAGELPVEGGVLQGQLESSNVTPATAMIEMIQASRYFEAAQRALRSIADTLQLNTKPNA